MYQNIHGWIDPKVQVQIDLVTNRLIELKYLKAGVKSNKYDWLIEVNENLLLALDANNEYFKLMN